MSAQWCVTEDPEFLSLRINLWNGHAVVLTAWKDDAAQPFVALCSDSAEHDLAEVTAPHFRRWLDGTQGRSSRRDQPQQRRG
jgi:hypothetical protein